MTTTPLTAIRIDGTMYLQEVNPHAYNSEVEYRREIGDWNAHDDFNRTHPPVIALFECQEGQTFVEGVDIRKVDQSFDGIYKKWVPSKMPNVDKATGYHVRQAFELIPKSERGDGEQKEPITEITIDGDKISYDTFENDTKFILIGNHADPRVWYCSNENLIKLRDFLNQLPF